MSGTFDLAGSTQRQPGCLHEATLCCTHARVRPLSMCGCGGNRFTNNQTFTHEPGYKRVCVVIGRKLPRCAMEPERVPCRFRQCHGAIHKIARGENGNEGA